MNSDAVDTVAARIAEAAQTPQVCVRCGHRSGGCSRCGQHHLLLGGRIKGQPYCHLQSKRSCYVLTLWELGVEAYRED
jgi:hypothetical protein